MTDLQGNLIIEVHQHGLYLYQETEFPGIRSNRLVMRADDWRELLDYVSFDARATVRVHGIS